MKTAIIYALYIIAGLFTDHYLKKKQMKVARQLYLLFFCVFFLYIPYISGSKLVTDLMGRMLSDSVRPIFYEFMSQPFIAAAPYVDIVFLTTIVFSLIITITLAVAAVVLYRVIFSNSGDTKIIRKDTSVKFSSYFTQKEKCRIPIWLKYLRITT